MHCKERRTKKKKECWGNTDRQRELLVIRVCGCFGDVDSSRDPCFLIDHGVFRSDAGGWIGGSGGDFGADKSLHGAVFVDPHEVGEIEE